MRVIKGPASIAYGPQTVGGAIDFISRPVPTRTSGAADLAARSVRLQQGARVVRERRRATRLLRRGRATPEHGLRRAAERRRHRLDPQRLDGEGGVHDRSPDAKTKHCLQLKLSYADEVSNETYLGQTDADFRTQPVSPLLRERARPDEESSDGHRGDAHDRGAGVVLPDQDERLPLRLPADVEQVEPPRRRGRGDGARQRGRSRVRRLLRRHDSGGSTAAAPEPTPSSSDRTTARSSARESRASSRRRRRRARWSTSSRAASASTTITSSGSTPSRATSCKEASSSPPARRRSPPRTTTPARTRSRST